MTALPAHPSASSSPPVVEFGGDHVEVAPGSVVKFRSPVMVAVLAVVTLGIHTLIWWYLINQEMAEHGRARGVWELGDDPAKSLLALFPGSLVVVPGIWTTVTTFQRIQAAQRLNGQIPLNGWIALILGVVFSPAMHGYMQSGLNSAWSGALADTRLSSATWT